MIIHGDSLEVLKRLVPNSIDAVVTDPPYGLSFMGKKWDYDVPSVELWREVFRVLKPGGHVLSFGGTRTYHRMVVNIEDAGFEIRDQVMWIYGSGFPKSHNLDGAHEGWGTALKPANEPICLARKPLEKGLTVAENVLKYGVGALNIDESRIGYNASEKIDFSKVQDGNIYGGNGIYGEAEQKQTTPLFKENGRWPANVLFDEAAASVLDEQSGNRPSRGAYKDKTQIDTGESSMFGYGGVGSEDKNKYANETGGASRFFYVAKASKRERNEGLEGMPEKPGGSNAKGYTKDVARGLDRNRPVANHHPTVKPIKLMEYLIRLVTPQNGTVLDPFMGSGSTGVASRNLGFNFIGIEMNEEYCEIARRRIGEPGDAA